MPEAEVEDTIMISGRSSLSLMSLAVGDHVETTTIHSDTITNHHIQMIKAMGGVTIVVGATVVAAAAAQVEIFQKRKRGAGIGEAGVEAKAVMVAVDGGIIAHAGADPEATIRPPVMIVDAEGRSIVNIIIDGMAAREVENTVEAAAMITKENERNTAIIIVASVTILMEMMVMSVIENTVDATGMMRNTVAKKDRDRGPNHSMIVRLLE